MPKKLVSSCLFFRRCIFESAKLQQRMFTISACVVVCASVCVSCACVCVFDNRASLKIRQSFARNQNECSSSSIRFQSHLLFACIKSKTTRSPNVARRPARRVFVFCITFKHIYRSVICKTGTSRRNPPRKFGSQFARISAEQVCSSVCIKCVRVRLC